VGSDYYSDWWETVFELTGGIPPPPLPIVVPGTKTALQVLSPLQGWKKLKKDNLSLPIPPSTFLLI